MKKKQTIIEKLAAFIVDRRAIVFFLFILLAIFCAFSRNWVSVNDDITEYLPDTTETRRGIVIMEEHFTTYGTAQIMVDNISYEQAEEIKTIIEDIPEVKSVTFDDTEDHYKSFAALYDITFDGDINSETAISGMEEIKKVLSDYDTSMQTEVGNPLKQIIAKEMLIVDILAVIVIVVVLFFTSRTYAEIPVLLITFGAAALLNMGTNFILGEISFVTDSIAIVLQLALAIDYAIIMVHAFSEQREKGLNPRDAAVVALSRAIPEISASSLTTIAGLAALTLMEFRLGYDMGIVLIKAILLSMFSVFFLMPGLLLQFSPWIDKTKHKNFVPQITFLGKFAYATRYIVPIIFVAVVIAGYVFSHKANYCYSVYSVPSRHQNEAQLEKEKIKQTFGKENILALVVPSGNYEAEGEMIKDLQQLEAVESVTALANVDVEDTSLTQSLTPREFSELTGLDYEVSAALYMAYASDKGTYGQFLNIENYSVPLIDLFGFLLDEKTDISLQLTDSLDQELSDLQSQLDDAKLQLKSDEYTRLVLNVNLPIEGEESFKYLDIIHGIMARYYDEYYIVGDTTSCSDLKASFEKDNLLISVLTVFFVVIVLLFTFKSVGMPALLILVIQGSIWLNFSTPYLLNNNLFFLTYLIICSIQMGANIDYAIVISNRYMELKEKMPIKNAMIESLNLAFPTIITSGLMLASAGIIIGTVTSDETISAIGSYIGSGTLISIFLVMCVLPQILLLGDSLISKTTFSINLDNVITERSGETKLDGRVRGYVNGYISAEVHGRFRGEIKAMIALGASEDIPKFSELPNTSADYTDRTQDTNSEPNLAEKDGEEK